MLNFGEPNMLLTNFEKPLFLRVRGPGPLGSPERRDRVLVDSSLGGRTGKVESILWDVVEAAKLADWRRRGVMRRFTASPFEFPNEEGRRE